MSFKFTAVGTLEEVVAQLDEYADVANARIGGDVLGRSIAFAIAETFRKTHVFVQYGMRQAFVLQMDGVYGGGNAPEIRITMQPFLHQPAKPIQVDLSKVDPTLVEEIAKAMGYEPQVHPEPTDENTDPRLLVKKQTDPLAQTGGIIGDDEGIHLKEF